VVGLFEFLGRLSIPPLTWHILHLAEHTYLGKCTHLNMDWNIT